MHNMTSCIGHLLVLALISFIRTEATTPNVVILLADDLGIGDVGCFGNTTIKTPNIDRLSREGVKLTHHVAAAPICTPSRGALVTGRLPIRYGLEAVNHGPPVILHVASPANLPESEVTMAEAFKAAGYETALIGKWHLGSGCGLLGRDCKGPLNHGFDTFYGIPLTLLVEFASNDSFFQFPLNETFYQGLLVSIIIAFSTVFYLAAVNHCKSSFFLFLLSADLIFTGWFFHTHYRFYTKDIWPLSPWMSRQVNSVLMNGNEIEEMPINLEGLSQKLAHKSVEFLKEKKDKPFFLYHGFPHVHTPMFTAPHMKGVSRHGRYGDNIEELDESVGIILKGLEDLGLSENTIVYFVSDQGGHLEAVDEEGQRIGGYNGKFKGGKTQGGAEGAIRVPGIMRWPGHIPAGLEVATPTSMMDIFPSLLSLSGLGTVNELVPEAEELDGHDIVPLLTEGDTRMDDYDDRVFVHYCRDSIHALRLIDDEKVYKMHLFKNKYQPGSTQCGWGAIVGCYCHDESVYDLRDQPHVHDLTVDPYEDHPLDPESEEYKEVVEELQEYLVYWREKEKTFPPSQLRGLVNAIWNPWLQPH